MISVKIDEIYKIAKYYRGEHLEFVSKFFPQPFFSNDVS